MLKQMIWVLLGCCCSIPVAIAQSPVTKTQDNSQASTPSGNPVANSGNQASPNGLATQGYFNVNTQNTGEHAGSTTHTYQAGSVTTNHVSPSQVTSRVISTPNATAPSLTYGGNDTCLGSTSGGVSGMGFGISGGSTVVDANCVILKNSQRLASMGLNNASLALLITVPETEQAVKIGSPAIYAQLIEERVAVLESEIQARAELDGNTQALREQLKEARILLRATKIRLTLKDKKGTDHHPQEK